MVPRPEGLVPPVGSSDAENRAGETRDPVRVAVQLALAIYLSPVFLVVCLIGGTSVLVNGMTRAFRHGGQAPVVRPAPGPKLSGRGHGKPVGRFAGLDRRPDVTR